MTGRPQTDMDAIAHHMWALMATGASQLADKALLFFWRSPIACGNGCAQVQVRVGLN